MLALFNVAMTTPSKSFRILLVEDHEDSAYLLSMMLAREAHVVSVAHSGKDAMALADEQAFDVVICDLGVRDIGGIDLVKAIRERHAYRGIIVSGFGDEIEGIDPAAVAGINCCITKPVDMGALRGALAGLS
jgi:CheY-like chemotaxis protein